MVPSNPTCEVSRVDVEEWIDADIWIEVSRTIAYEDLINAVMNPDSERKTLENISSDEEIVRDKISWSNAVGVYCTTVKFTESMGSYQHQSPGNCAGY